MTVRRQSRRATRFFCNGFVALAYRMHQNASDYGEAMRILRILSSLDPADGGPVSVFSAAVISIASTGAHIECLTLEPADRKLSDFPDHERLVERGIKVHAFRTLREACGFVVKSVRSYDVVHIDGCWQPLCVFAVLAARIAGASALASPHESLTQEDLRRTKSLPRLALKRLLRFYYHQLTDCFVYASELELRDSLKQESAVVISHPVFDDVSEIPHEEARQGLAAAGRTTVGYLGRFHYKKRLEDIARAFTQTDGIDLILAGSGVDDYETVIRDILDKNEHVKWLGFVQRDEREAFFRNIDFLVLASEYECFGMAAAEALVRGVPVIVTRRVGVSDDVSRTGGGWVIDTGVEALAQAFKDCAALTRDAYRELQSKALSARSLYAFSTHGRFQVNTYANLQRR